VLEVVDGALPVPDAPGLGVEIVEEEVARYPARRNVADLPPDDGWGYEPGTTAEAIYFQTRMRRRARLRRTV
jgi:galactonate dehydratase